MPDAPELSPTPEIPITEEHLRSAALAQAQQMLDEERTARQTQAVAEIEAICQKYGVQLFTDPSIKVREAN